MLMVPPLGQLNIGFWVQGYRIQAFGDPALIVKVKTLAAHWLLGALHWNAWGIIIIDRDHGSHPQEPAAGTSNTDDHEAHHSPALMSSASCLMFAIIPMMLPSS